MINSKGRGTSQDLSTGQVDLEIICQGGMLVADAKNSCTASILS
jgi:hypothetical protein